MAETLKELLKIVLGPKIEVFMEHKNPIYETVESDSQCVYFWTSLIQEFGVTLLYIKEKSNVVADYFSRLSMAHHDHKLTDTTMEENTCKLLCLDSLFISGNIECFCLDIEDILFPLAPQIVEAEQKLEI